MTLAFFISPKGIIIPVEITHINKILDSPDMFGLTKEYVHSVFDRYNEPYGMEGNARNYILLKLIKRGWIRVRYNPKYDMLTVQLDMLNSNEKSRINNLAFSLMDKKYGKYSVYTTVRVIDTNKNILLETNLGELAEKHESL